MDRRQRKSREAIFQALKKLLTTKSYSQITVNDIIEQADVGRATFYSHFETKDYLLKELCNELLNHIFDEKDESSSHLFDCDAPNSVFLHLFMHFYKDDNNIVKLFSSQNTDLFFQYFRKDLKDRIQKHLKNFKNNKPQELPEEIWVNHILSTFLETLRWWIENGMIETPEVITNYFYLLI